MNDRACLERLQNTLRQWCQPNRTLVVGLVGLPGAGKSTLAKRLVDDLGGVVAATVSLDDFYWPAQERLARGLAMRGPPGSHDLALLADFLAAVQQRPSTLHIPVFDRGLEQRVPARACQGPLDLLLFEGFLVGIDVPGYEPLKNALDKLMYLDIDPDAALCSRRKREVVNRTMGQPGLSDSEVVAMWENHLWPHVQPHVLPLIDRSDVVVFVDSRHRLRSLQWKTVR